MWRSTRVPTVGLSHCPDTSARGEALPHTGVLWSPDLTAERRSRPCRYGPLPSFRVPGLKSRGAPLPPPGQGMLFSGRVTLVPPQGVGKYEKRETQLFCIFHKRDPWFGNKQRWLGIISGGEN